MDEKTEYRKELLKQLRSNLAGILKADYPDGILMHWLKGASYDLEKAEENFRQVYTTIQFYAIEDRLLKNYVKPEVLENHVITSFIGFAKDGSPVRYVSLEHDIEGVVKSISSFDLALYYIYMIDSDIKRMQEENIKTRRNNSEIIYIFNVEDMSISGLIQSATLEVGLDFLRLLQEWYPEIWNCILLVNAPYLSDKIMSFFRSILRDSISQKIFVASKASTPKLLLKYIDEDVLPAFLGGTRVDSKGDPYCKELIKPVYRGMVPEKLYLRNSMHFLTSTDTGVTTVDIGPRSVYNIPIVIRTPGAAIRGEFRTENGSINYHQFHREFMSGEEENPDLPSTNEYIDYRKKTCSFRMVGVKLKVQTHIAPIDRTAYAVWPGVYVIQFDNTDSWFTSRKLFYRFSITPAVSLKQ